MKPSEQGAPIRCACGRPSHGPHPHESERDRLCSHCLAVRKVRERLIWVAVVLIPLGVFALFMYERWLNR